MFLLNKNLEQLLHVHGIEGARLQNTLPNLWKLMVALEDPGSLPTPDMVAAKLGHH